ncbi:MAG: VanZ family protein [Pseudomonadota bacterium]
MRHILAYLITLVVALLIARVMLGPVGDTGLSFPHMDKVVHFVAFACLALPLSISQTHPRLWIFGAGLGFGALIELIQPQFGRTADWIDLLSDAAGLVLGLAAGYALTRGRPRQ